MYNIAGLPWICLMTALDHTTVTDENRFGLVIASIIADKNSQAVLRVMECMQIYINIHVFLAR